MNWSFYDDICKVDIMTAASDRNMRIVESTNLNLNMDNNIILFRLNEETWRREIRIVKIEEVEHPLDWLPFKITGRV